MSDNDRWQQDVGESNNASKLRKVWLYANVEQSSDYQWEDSGGHVIRLQQFKMVTVTNPVFNWGMFLLHTILLFLCEQMFSVCTIEGST